MANETNKELQQQLTRHRRVYVGTHLVCVSAENKKKKQKCLPANPNGVINASQYSYWAKKKLLTSASIADAPRIVAHIYAQSIHTYTTNNTRTLGDLFLLVVVIDRLFVSHFSSFTFVFSLLIFFTQHIDSEIATISHHIAVHQTTSNVHELNDLHQLHSENLPENDTKQILNKRLSNMSCGSYRLNVKTLGKN